MLKKKLRIRGSVPNKKDRLRPGRPGQKMHYDRGDSAAMAAIVHQMRSTYGQWRPHYPPEHSDISVRLFVRNRRGDRDGKLAVLLDCMVQAGVLRNDSIARCNGRIVIEPAEVRQEEGAEIVISWEGE